MGQAWAALTDPTRREIVSRLAVRDLGAGEIADAFSISRPGVSRHLRVLRDAGLVRSEAVGQRRIYSLNVEVIDEIEQWASEVRTLWEQRLDALDTEIARGNRARRKTGR